MRDSAHGTLYEKNGRNRASSSRRNVSQESLACNAAKDRTRNDLIKKYDMKLKSTRFQAKKSNHRFHRTLLTALLEPLLVSVSPDPFPEFSSTSGFGCLTISN